MSPLPLFQQVVMLTDQDDEKYSKSVARTEEPDYKNHGGVDIERISQTDEDDKAKSRDITVNEIPVLRQIVFFIQQVCIKLLAVSVVIGKLLVVELLSGMNEVLHP